MKPALFLSHVEPIGQHLFESSDVLDRFDIFRDLTEFAAASNTIKAAYIAPNNYENLLDVSLLEAIKDVDIVLVRVVEVHRVFVRMMQEWDLPNFHYFIAGALNFKLQYATVHSHQYWMMSTQLPYAQVPAIANVFADWKFKDQRAQKEYAFDCMYGKARKHRKIAHRIINELITDPKAVFQTEFLPVTSVHCKATETNPDTWESDIIPLHGDPMNSCIWHGHNMMPSQVLPQKVYLNTISSMVFETHQFNEFSFFTEKIAKPILAGRLFVVYSGQYYLRNLRELGFQTFSTIIDESYDDVEDIEERFTLATKAALSIAHLTVDELRRQIKDIVRHNQKQLYRIYKNYKNTSPEWVLGTLSQPA